MGIPNLGPAPKARDPEAVKRWLHKLSQRVGPNAVPIFSGLILTGLNPNEIVITDGNKQLTTTNTIDGGEEV